jgi:bifunctional oligoribonuclease and PAP phosphatase NrnA
MNLKTSNTDLAAIAEVLKTRERFVVMSHMRPDGDALGCTLAMALCLRQLGKDVTAWNEDGMLDKFRYLPGGELVTVPPAEPQRFEVAIVLDNAVRNRAGTAIQAVAHADVWINIDHHITNEHYGDTTVT